MNIQREIETINRHAGGSTLTKIARATALAQAFDLWRHALNLQVKSLAKVKVAHVVGLVRHQLDAGKSRRSLQNDLAHLRTGLRCLGREQFAAAEMLGNRALGVSGASRDGTHRALSQAHYEQVLGVARLRDPGLSAALQLQRVLGLRAREAVQSVASLKQWERALASGQPVRVIHGTKGSLARDSGPVDTALALQAVREALQVVQTNSGQLIGSSSLAGAMRSYGRHCQAVGLSGEHASHALRCMYARDRYAQHLQAFDGDRREALAATSLDLGHGDGRGTYVAQVYLRLAPE